MAFRITENRQAIAEVLGATDPGARLAAEFFLERARAGVPIEEGTLERSGEVVEVSPGRYAVRFNNPYATSQHEELTWRHDEGRRAKYLELAVEENKATGLAIIAEQSRAGES
ncbi:hypothetical protein GCM10027586_00800 [Kineococcus gypseus]|uniref:hypothetical protein n=1 Tax=Kineococcus gypseus TaxID=1637102 RepID=UPI003D7ECD49